MVNTRTLSKWVQGNKFYEDANVSPTNTMWETCPLLAIQNDPTIAFQWFEDFNHFTTTQRGLTSVLTNTGAAAAYGTEMGGILEIQTSDGTVADNDESYVGSTTPFILPGAGQDIWAEFRVKFVEANTDDANIIVGLSSLYSANMLLDNGAGPAANYSGALFYKVDGGTVWNCETSTTTSQTTITSVATRRSGVWTRLGIHITGTSKADFYIDGVLVATSSTYLPAAVMGILMGVKNGTTTEESLLVDFFRLIQLRG